jgi:hypothetical protein
VYAYLTDGLDPERREQFDRTLDSGSPVDEKAKARREREAIARLMNLPGG